MWRASTTFGLLLMLALAACERKPTVLSDQLPPLNRALSERVPEMLAADLAMAELVDDSPPTLGFVVMTWAEGALILAGALDGIEPASHWLRLQPDANCAAATDLPRYGPVRGDVAKQWKAYIDTGLQGSLTDFEGFAVGLYDSEDAVVLACGTFSTAVK
ncbi:MAG: hypothetical protein AAGJ86_05815 [Pseudomonadota bacterium]